MEKQALCEGVGVEVRVKVWMGVGVRLGVGCPCPPVRNDIVTPFCFVFIAILEYLKDASGSKELPEDILYEILAPFWHEEPFKSHGFVLEGFPRTPNEAKFLSEAGLYPGNMQ